MKKTSFLIALLLFVLSIPGVFLTAQKKEIPAFKNFPVLTAQMEEDGKTQTLKMDLLSIDVKIIGTIAVTTMEMSFYNSTNRILEGSLSFPLGEGEKVTRFAMEIPGGLREGVVVEKAKARQVFESIEREKIDPGILEETRGNHFNARVYPIPAKGSKKIIVAYESPLSFHEKGLKYLLPLGFKDAIEDFSLKINVFEQPLKPGITTALKGAAFKEIQGGFNCEMKRTNILLEKPLEITIPVELKKEQIFIESYEQDTYFYIHLMPEKNTKPKKLPGKIAVYWDASLSADKKDKNKEIQLLEKYLEKIGNAEVTLIVFRNEAEELIDFKIKNGKSESFIKTLNNLVYDGATQLGQLDFNKTQADEILLFTDGISNMGKREITLSQTPVIVINSLNTAEHSYLNYIARQTSGNYINLAKLDLEQAFSRISTAPYSFISLESKDNGVKQVYPGIGAPLSGDFGIAGRLVKDSAEVKLNFGYGNKITASKTILLTKNKHKTESGLLKRIWAQKKIAELELQYDKNESEITRLAKAFGIVTRGTSFIVLDRLEDYVKYQIIPPTKELKAQYLEALAGIEKNKENIQKSHIESVLSLLHKREQWHKKDFPMGDLPKKEVIPSKSDAREGSRAATDSSADRESLSERRPEAEPNVDRKKFKKGKKASPGKDVSSSDKDEDGEEETKQATITLKQWSPDTPYLKELKEKNSSQWYSTYLKQRKDYLSSSAFYLDVADFFIEKDQKQLAVRILSNIAEMQLENPALLRILAHRLAQIKEYKLSLSVFQDVLKMREEEPQSYRDMGLVYELDGQYQKAVDMLYRVVSRPWDARFPEIQIIALGEMNAIIANHPENLKLTEIDPRLIKNFPLDIRVTLSWDADNCDMDLWIIDANGEKSFYGYQLSYMGGLMSRDFTGGYGPEEYLLKNAKPGKYTIQVNYYGNRQQILAGATTVQVKLFTFFGTKKQKYQEITLRLKENREVVTVGEFEFGK